MYTPIGLILSSPLKLKNINNQSPVDVLIVLDGGTYPNGQLSLFSLERLVNAITLYRQGYAKKLLLSGNREDFGNINYMAQTAQQLGVASSDLILEDESHNTYENLKNSQVLLSKYENLKIGVITNSFHLARTMAISKKLNFPLTPFQVPDYDKYRLNSVNRLILTQYTLREYCAFVLYKLKGYL